MMRFLGALDYRIENAELLKEDDGCLIIANHPSLLDYVFLTSLMPRCDCIVKEALFDNFFTRKIIRRAGYIPNRDAKEVLDTCNKRLQAGSRILVFPEGTRSVPGQPLKLQRGAANIAIRCEVPMRVVHITCRPPILTKRQKWWQTSDRKPLFTISIREKIDISPFLDPSFPPAHSARLLNKYLERALNPNLESSVLNESSTQRTEATDH